MYVYSHRVQGVNCHLNYAQVNIIFTSKFIRYIYQNYIKISLNNL